MKKLLATIMGIAMLSSGVVFADANFTPLSFDDSNAVKAPATTTAKTVSGVEAKGTDLLDPAQVIGGTKMQNSILQMDNAQIEIRNKLLNYRAKYSEIDGRYETAKAERKAMKKQIKQAEKQIKNIDKAKKSIRKNFERRSNI